jgi:hypothetical protein
MSKRNQSLVLLAATVLSVAACSSKYDSDYVEPGPAANGAPVVAAIADRTVDQDTTIGPIDFGVNDGETQAANLVVSAAADGTSLFPADGITLGGSGAVRNITLTPLEATTGAATITVTVTDGAGAVTTRSFAVTVNARAASLRDTALSTFAKAESDGPTTVNGFTFAQDADDPATFASLIGEE